MDNNFYFFNLSSPEDLLVVLAHIGSAQHTDLNNKIWFDQKKRLNLVDKKKRLNSSLTKKKEIKLTENVLKQRYNYKEKQYENKICSLHLKISYI